MTIVISKQKGIQFHTGAFSVTDLVQSEKGTVALYHVLLLKDVGNVRKLEDFGMIQHHNYGKLHKRL